MPTIELNLELLIKQYSNYLLKTINNIENNTLSYEDKEEILSSAFYLLWKNSGNSKIASPGAYLTTTVKHLTYDYLRKQKKTYEYEDCLVGDENNLDTLLLIEEKLQLLTQEEKKIFTMFYVEGYKIKEISKKENKKLTTVKVMLYRIRKKLKEGK